MPKKPVKRPVGRPAGTRQSPTAAIVKAAARAGYAIIKMSIDKDQTIHVVMTNSHKAMGEAAF